MIETDAGGVDLAWERIGFDELGEPWICGRSIVYFGFRLGMHSGSAE